MSAILQRFHQVANDALVKVSEHCLPGAKIALVIYTPGKPEEDIVLKDQGLDDNEVVSSLRRRGLSIDGDNAYKRDLCDSIIGALAFGAQKTNPPPTNHWGQRFWDIGREERASSEQLLRDANDLPVLGTLLAAIQSVDVHYLITGDKDLLVLSDRYPIISPADFWAKHGGP